jgi:GNAT superfamily N-acetyltransferase
MVAAVMAHHQGDRPNWTPAGREMLMIRRLEWRYMHPLVPMADISRHRQETYVIRPARAQDEAQIRDCAEQAYARFVPLIGQKPAPMVADFKTQIAAGSVHVATDDDGIFQGFIVFYPRDRNILLENVAVLPSAAGKGIGKALIGFCEDQARRGGFRAMQLYTNEKMSENLSIYPRLGYTEVARRTEEGFNRVFFEKALI